MLTSQNNEKSINQLLDRTKNRFYNDINSSKVKTQTKWGEFAEKMDVIFTPDIVQHISNSCKEAKDNFIANT